MGVRVTSPVTVFCKSVLADGTEAGEPVSVRVRAVSIYLVAKCVLSDGDVQCRGDTAALRMLASSEGSAHTHTHTHTERRAAATMLNDALGALDEEEGNGGDGCCGSSSDDGSEQEHGQEDTTEAEEGAVAQSNKVLVGI
jgi:hypothetical protein